MNTVKKFSCVVVLFFFCSLSTSGQSTAFGIKGGLNLTTLKVSDPQASYDSRTGFHAGIFVREKFSKVAVQPELFLSTQKTKISSSAIGEVHDSFTYLSIPILLKFYLIDGLNIHAGPQFGFLLDGDRKYDGPLGSGTDDIKDYYDGSDMSISIGGGWDIPIGLHIDVRYNIGVKDINDVADGEEAKSRVFQVSLGWNFLN